MLSRRVGKSKNVIPKVGKSLHIIPHVWNKLWMKHQRFDKSSNVRPHFWQTKKIPNELDCFQIFSFRKSVTRMFSCANYLVVGLSVRCLVGVDRKVDNDLCNRVSKVLHNNLHRNLPSTIYTTINRPSVSITIIIHFIYQYIDRTLARSIRAYSKLQ